jgi:CRP-like cAMP-binding protein
LATLDAFANRLLARLPAADFALIRPHLTTRSFAQGTVLGEAGDEVDQIYFPLDGMISLLVMLNEGKAIETATVGRGGVFGASAAFGLYRSMVRAIVQVSMTATIIPAAQFRKAAEASSAIRLLSIKYNEELLAQARIIAACNAVHSVEARLCRWLLQTRAITDSNTIHLTQEFLSEMLGVRRTSVTEVASRLQEAELIRYARGVINILDLSGLEQRACECVRTLQEQRAI